MVKPFLLSAATLAIPLFLAGGTDLGANNDRNRMFEPVPQVQVPHNDSGPANNDIDRFVLAKLQQQGLQQNKPTDRRTLIRRAYFDLIGLPPTPAQVDAFLRDPASDAFSKVIDELLDSTHYGERWGRHWLDLARYADTSGDGADAPIPEARLYRDYVIDSFNQDLPYDQFIREQIAGDLLAEEENGNRLRERLIATGYVALARRFGNGEYADMHLVIDNTLTTISKGMLGLNVSCARCHDHKFDPISMEDYYGLFGYFSSTQYPHAGTEHGRERKNFVPLPGGGVAYSVLDKSDPGEIGDAPLLERGEPRDKGELVPRGFLDFIDSGNAAIPQGSSGRLELARWITSPTNPLTARVMVNRIWQYHFGQGLVPTSSDFGNQGEPPTHPALLDWLADQFVKSGWSIKAMHRLIMRSNSYQLSSNANKENLEKDPNNHWLWRFPRQRLEAEPIRDSVLFISGRLKQGNPGRHPFPEPDENNAYQFTQHRPFIEDYDHEYRSVYLPSRRLAKHPYMATFDGPDTNECAANRHVSTVPLQSLFWMNSDFIRDNARTLATHLIDAHPQTSERIRQACLATLARPPSEDEYGEFTHYLKQYREELDDGIRLEDRELQTWTSFCRILLSSNEFIYID